MESQGEAATSSQAAVQATNDDASASKLSCVKKGYIRDDYVQFFVRRPVKRSPLINRGYFARWAAIRELMMQFLASSPKQQVISLGAGFDTTFFQLNEEAKAPDLYLELDFAEVTSKKSIIIGSHPELRNHLGPSTTLSPGMEVLLYVLVFGIVLHSMFHFLCKDGGHLILTAEIARISMQRKKAQVDFSLPTLILGECVLIYMDPNASRRLIKWAADKFTTAAFVIYEQINAHDAFGQQMIRNLESRGCPLLGIYDTSSLETKKTRFLNSGWEKAVAHDMDEIYNGFVNPAERRRIERLEIFDEFEEWHIMQEHYCVSYGIKDKDGVFKDFGFKSGRSVI